MMQHIIFVFLIEISEMLKWAIVLPLLIIGAKQRKIKSKNFGGSVQNHILTW